MKNTTLSVNLLIRTSPTKIIQDLENCELVNFNVDNLKGFQKIFPDESTVSNLYGKEFLVNKRSRILC